MRNIPFLFSLALISLLTACNKDEFPEPPVSIGDMADCHQETTWDSISVAQALHGTWQWEFVQCFWTPDDANNEEYAGLEMIFEADGTLEVREAGQVTQTANWEVTERNDDLFELDVDPPVIQLYGQILFCEDRVLFNHSYIDGCDHYFIR